MSKDEKYILLGHGSGGRMMHDLISGLFLKHFSNAILDEQSDSAILPVDSAEIAFTTDTFVIDPVFFPGGDIGKLAVCGTVNDLAVAGAEPLYISVSFILEEGLPFSDLERIVESLAAEARKAGVQIVTGDTKVVNKGKCDKIFINTAGIGRIRKEDSLISKGTGVQAGDLILINGTLGDHGMAVMNARESFNFRAKLESDCASLNHLIRRLLYRAPVKFMRDPTRGGVATVLNELAAKTSLGIEIDENTLPVNGSVRAMAELLGFDPLHIANEGKVIVVATPEDAGILLQTMQEDELGQRSAIIGRMTAEHPGKVILKNETGGKRIIDPLSGDQLPRIC
jgi:hydrogenase expression/formation protein HypE